uniref:Uncharacterized protein n=1 Tax=Branchiostoma floridae TaxID=7739 RepID=C3ZUL2_BRAFL|eukprot:XP_002587713.1 hypothetical protein BRAFLDRAFT_94616 [Branchiostoma floridae]
MHIIQFVDHHNFVDNPKDVKDLIYRFSQVQEVSYEFASQLNASATAADFNLFASSDLFVVESWHLFAKRGEPFWLYVWFEEPHHLTRTSILQQPGQDEKHHSPTPPEKSRKPMKPSTTKARKHTEVLASLFNRKAKYGSAGGDKPVNLNPKCSP